VEKKQKASLSSAHDNDAFRTAASNMLAAV